MLFKHTIKKNITQYKVKNIQLPDRILLTSESQNNGLQFKNSVVVVHNFHIIEFRLHNHQQFSGMVGILKIQCL